MTKELVIRMADAANAGVCTTGIRPEMTRLGLSWRHFKITGYSEGELYAAFGKDHLIVKRVADWMRQQERIRLNGKS